MLRKSLIFICTFFYSIAFFYSTVQAADTTPPVTTASFSGVAGQNNWFRSGIEVTLTATDSESGPRTTTYQVDSGTPTVVTHDVLPVGQFLNSSFESGSFWNANNWNPGEQSGYALYYTSRYLPHQGNRSIAIAALGSGQYFHWKNEAYAVMFTPGANVRISSWLRAILFNWNSAYFEVWGQDANGSGDILLGTSAGFFGVTSPWRQVTVDFVVPVNTNYVYLKLGGNINPGGVVYWDDVTTTSLSSGEVEVVFTYSVEGNHTLTYYSTDNNANTEASKTSPLKIDTVVPNPWQTFSSTRSSCNHCYEASVEVRDITSGVDVSTAEYRYYTDHSGLLWSGWLPVASVKKTGGNQNASDGETDFVTLTTPEIDFGDSSPGPFKVQYQIYDMAGNLGTSPVYQIVAPWLKADGGSWYMGGEISLAPAPLGEYNANADVFVGQTIESINNTTGWVQNSYDHSQKGLSNFNDFYPYYTQLVSQADPLPNNNLPTTDGVYIYQGDYAIDAQALQAGFETADVSSVIIIQGNLSITKEFTRGAQNFTVFFVTGDVFVDKNVQDISGILVIDGRFISDDSGHATKKLTVHGSIIALDGFTFSRDLGDSGPVNNQTDPGEFIDWQPSFLFDEQLIYLITGSEQKYVWQEVEE